MIISILCGGSGTRLWPLSRELLPKQFAPILPDSKILFEKTLERNNLQDAKISIITNEAHYFLASDILKKSNITPYNFFLESAGKNTAPAICLQTLHIACENKDEILLFIPSDHLIKDSKAYLASVQEAIELAKRDYIITFGIKPTFAHTGYGYIKTSERIEDSKNGLMVECFVEKPDLKSAQHYLSSGQYFWNSGMFCFKADVFLKEMEKHSPALLNQCKKIYESASLEAQILHKTKVIRLNSRIYEDLEPISIDYALMEKSERIGCIRAEFDWSDVGDFEALRSEYKLDSANNASKGEILALDSKENFIFADKLVATIGVDNIAAIDTQDCLLISSLEQTQRIKEVVSILKTSHPELTKTHTTVFRPWGSYSVLLESSNYKIKKIIVAPSHRLSLQKHFHRNEHWIVVKGSAIVKVGDKEIFLSANQSTYIPMGEVHRLENPGKFELILIEVQVGEYLGEDDIVRLSDDYIR